MQPEAVKSPFNRIIPGKKSLGIVTSAVAYQYVKEIFPEYSILKLGWTNPLPKALVRKFAKSVEKLLVVEELDPFLEDQIKAMGIATVAHKTDLNMFELNADRLQELRHEILKDVPKTKKAKVPELPTRPQNLKLIICINFKTGLLTISYQNGPVAKNKVSGESLDMNKVK